MVGVLEPLYPFTPFLALLVRVVVGIAYILHGYPKVTSKGRQQVAQWMKSIGIPPMAGYLAGVLEFFGGILLIIGFIVPIVALLFAIQMVSTTLLNKVKLKKAYIGGYELDILFLLLVIVLIVLGAGVASIDQLLGL